MKVIAINGSPRKSGNTHHAIEMVFEQLKAQGIETKEIQIGNQAVRGCISCGGCARNCDEKCTLPEDIVNECIQEMKSADGILLGAPTYYAGMPGTMKSFLDRAFYVAGSNGGLFRHKVGASVAIARRAGSIQVYDELNRYLQYSEMFMPSANYWASGFGRAEGEVEVDEEGMQIFKVLGKNFAYLLKTLELSEAELALPEREKKIMTSFVR